MQNYTTYTQYEYDALVIEGGGVKGVFVTGALKKLEELGILQNIKKFAGSSAGAILVGALACGYTADELYEVMKELDFNQFKDGYGWVFGKLYRLFRKYGLYRGKTFYDWYGDIIAVKTGDKDITLEQIYYNYGKTVVVTGTCMNRKKTYYYSHITHPNMTLRKAVRISMGIPGFFEAIFMRNEEDGQMDILVDGGYLNNYPIKVFDKDYDESVDLTKKVIGINLFSHDEHPESQIYNGYTDINGMIDYLGCLFSTALLQIERLHIHKEDWLRTIPIQSNDVSAIDFDLSLKKKQEMFKSGYDDACAFFE